MLVHRLNTLRVFNLCATLKLFQKFYIIVIQKKEEISKITLSFDCVNSKKFTRTIMEKTARQKTT